MTVQVTGSSLLNNAEHLRLYVFLISSLKLRGPQRRLFAVALRWPAQIALTLTFQDRIIARSLHPTRSISTLYCVPFVSICVHTLVPCHSLEAGPRWLSRYQILAQIGSRTAITCTPVPHSSSQEHTCPLLGLARADSTAAVRPAKASQLSLLVTKHVSERLDRLNRQFAWKADAVGHNPSGCP